MELKILWASMWGAAEEVAGRGKTLAESKNIDAEMIELNDVSMDQLKEMKNVAVVTSTTGHGDLPTNGEEFYDALKIADLNLREMKFSVCALGDSSHTYFCGAGKKVDERLQQLGAVRILDRQECDGDDEGSDDWAENFLTRLSNGT